MVAILGLMVASCQFGAVAAQWSPAEALRVCRDHPTLCTPASVAYCSIVVQLREYCPALCGLCQPPAPAAGPTAAPTANLTPPPGDILAQPEQYDYGEASPPAPAAIITTTATAGTTATTATADCSAFR